jgi:hypothetical protein
MQRKREDGTSIHVQDFIKQGNFIKLMKKALKESEEARIELGGFFYMDQNGSKYIHKTSTAHSTSSTIDLNNPPEEHGCFLVGNYHTHPNSGEGPSDLEDPWNPEPSGADLVNAWYRGVPGIVVHSDGLFAYGPPFRINQWDDDYIRRWKEVKAYAEDLTGPKGYIINYADSQKLAEQKGKRSIKTMQGLSQIHKLSL